jgi:hypothetical protein
LWKGAVNTAATSLASSLGMRDSSASISEDASPVPVWRKATHGLTPSSVLAKNVDSSHKCSIRKGGGIFLSFLGSPISSHASLRAVSNAVSSSVSALPPGSATCPAS